MRSAFRFRLVGGRVRLRGSRRWRERTRPARENLRPEKVFNMRLPLSPGQRPQAPGEEARETARPRDGSRQNRGDCSTQVLPGNSGPSMERGTVSLPRSRARRDHRRPSGRRPHYPKPTLQGHECNSRGEFKLGLRAAGLRLGPGAPQGPIGRFAKVELRVGRQKSS